MPVEQHRRVWMDGEAAALDELNGAMSKLIEPFARVFDELRTEAIYS